MDGRLANVPERRARTNQHLAWTETFEAVRSGPEWEPMEKLRS
jgi:hypothetical protein